MVQHEENFLDAALGNLYDYIKNTVYSLQTYTDVFHFHVSSICLDYDDQNDNEDIKQVLKFVVMEYENILKSKSISFALEIENILTRKYKSLSERIQCDKGKHKYWISTEAYQHLNLYQDEINWEKVTLNPYFKKESDTNQIYQFVNYMNHEFENYKEKEFRLDNKPITDEELITVLYTMFMKLNVTIIRLKKIIEKSFSLYTSAMVCNKIISILVLTYTVLSTIKFYEE